MTSQLVAIALIALVVALCPFVASLIPGRPIPETVFLVFAGALLGPNGLSVIHTNVASIDLLSQLGLAFLFLMAGYELEPQRLVGGMGRHAIVSWAVSFVLALGVVFLLLPTGDAPEQGLFALAIVMTTTAFGTLAPILRDRGLVGTPVGDAVTVYGAYGELLPVVAMAFLLSSRTMSVTALVLAAFLAICVAMTRVPAVAKRAGSRVVTFLQDNAETGAQAGVRLTVLLLVSLVALSAAFDLDVVLGAFAAGFILRAATPKGNHVLESKLDAIAYGFLVPLFFVVSGAKIDLAAASARPGLMIGFIALLLLVRTAPIFWTLGLSPETKGMNWRERFSVSVYCTMALPLIVAVTDVAVESGALTEELSSVLVCAGAITVLVVPVVTSLVRVTSEAHPILAVSEVMHDPSHFRSIIGEHVSAAAQRNALFHQLRKDGSHGENLVSSTEYLAQRAQMLEQIHTMRRKAVRAEIAAEREVLSGRAPHNED